MTVVTTLPRRGLRRDRFLKLPLEIRLIVYDQLIQDPQLVVRIKRPHTSLTTIQLLYLVRVCRQIRAEALPHIGRCISLSLGQRVLLSSLGNHLCSLISYIPSVTVSIRIPDLCPYPTFPSLKRLVIDDDCLDQPLALGYFDQYANERNNDELLRRAQCSLAKQPWGPHVLHLANRLFKIIVHGQVRFGYLPSTATANPLRKVAYAVDVDDNRVIRKDLFTWPDEG